MNQERALLAAPEEWKQARRSSNSATQAQRQAYTGLSATEGKEMAKRRHCALLTHFEAPNSTEKGHISPQIRGYEGSRRRLYEQKEAFPTLQTRKQKDKGSRLYRQKKPLASTRIQRCKGKENGVGVQKEAFASVPAANLRRIPKPPQKNLQHTRPTIASRPPRTDATLPHPTRHHLPKNAAQCISQRSALRWPTQRAASCIAPHRIKRPTAERRAQDHSAPTP